MRSKFQQSRSGRSLTDRDVHAYAVSWLTSNLSWEKSGYKCTAAVIWDILLMAAARCVSIFAVCVDLENAPGDDAIRNAIEGWLPKRTQTLEAWFEPILAGQRLPKALFRKARILAIDWHSIPYHGEPQRWSNELRHGPPKSGTTKSHTYATACVVHAGMRYTLAITCVKQNESVVDVTARLLDRLQKRGLRIKVLLLDRQFCTRSMMADLQSRKLPYVMPLMLRGRKAKKRPSKSRRKKPKTLRDFRNQKAGRYHFDWTGSQKDGPAVTFDVVVTYKSYRHRKREKRQTQKMLFAAWHVPGSPVEIRELYRQRFGIESSYRQLGQARIRTSTRSPVERLLYVLIALVLRNLWVWLHGTHLAEFEQGEVVLHLERLRFRRMLDWIAHIVYQACHDNTAYIT